MAPYSGILTWKILWAAQQATVYGVAKVSDMTWRLTNSNKGISLVMETRENILKSIFY